MRWLIVALPLALLLAPTAQAATEGTIETWVEPEHMTIDPRKHIQRDGQEPERQFFDVHVEGSIQCQPLTGAPVMVFVEASGSGRLSEGSENITYFDYSPRNFTLQWESQGGGEYTVEGVQRIEVVSNGLPPGNGLNATITWNSAQAEFRGTTRCDPDGYGWVSDSQEHVVFIPGTGAITSTSDTGTAGAEPSPLGWPLALVAVAFAALLRRK